jgi:hypothetical protein
MILEACAKADAPKEFRIILPSLTNSDIVARAPAAGKNPDDVRARLADWHELYAKTALTLKDHTLEIRTTEEPHRYHAIFGETEGIAGFAWHRKASLTTTSMPIAPAAEDYKWMLCNLIEDFDAYWETCHPYSVGDNKKRLTYGGIKVSLNPIVMQYGRGKPSMFTILKAVENFPDSVGNGATADQICALTGIHATDANKKMIELERDGLLRKPAAMNGRECHGRVISTFGSQQLQLWERQNGRVKLR